MALEDLRQFTGSENYHRHGMNRKFIYTDGVCRGHNLFMQQRAAAAFDQSQLRIHFIRTVNRHIDLLTLIQRGKGNPQACRLLP